MRSAARRAVPSCSPTLLRTCTDLALRLSTKLPSSARMKNYTIAKQGLLQRQLWRK
jgi:hypothetical protein